MPPSSACTQAHVHVHEYKRSFLKNCFRLPELQMSGRMLSKEAGFFPLLFMIRLTLAKVYLEWMIN